MAASGKERAAYSPTALNDYFWPVANWFSINDHIVSALGPRDVEDIFAKSVPRGNGSNWDGCTRPLNSVLSRCDGDRVDQN